ncbi:hypothetical protein FJT64_005597 [Amphibalanus amphitrite]|uniref:Uncharacterized protein n=1 Tax=Amphibalanus amphitrite TaxID=1232801 RepID=A0A6A4VVP4_AMPAM|nr:hypothetical protein FJT64_005597 [Amphibalanus amphitrite]
MWCFALATAARWRLRALAHAPPSTWLRIGAVLALIAYALFECFRLRRLYDRELVSTGFHEEPVGPPPLLSVCVPAWGGRLLGLRPVPSADDSTQWPLLLEREDDWRRLNVSAGLTPLWLATVPPVHQLVVSCNGQRCAPGEDGASPLGVWTTQLGFDVVCFTLRPNGSLDYDSVLDVSYGQRGPLLHLQLPPELPWATLKLHFGPLADLGGPQSQDDAPHSFRLEAGRWHRVVAEETETQRLQLWRRPCQPTPADSRGLCVERCVGRLSSAAAGCRLPWTLAAREVPECSNFAALRRALWAVKALDWRALEHRCRCLDPCLERRVALHGRHGRWKGAPAGRLLVQLRRQDRASISTEQLVMGLEETAAAACGMISLLLGVSAVAALDWLIDLGRRIVTVTCGQTDSKEKEVDAADRHGRPHLRRGWPAGAEAATSDRPSGHQGLPRRATVGALSEAERQEPAAALAQKRPPRSAGTARVAGPARVPETLDILVHRG